jgi:hypothetical protein
MLLSEIIAVYSENHIKTYNTAYDKTKIVF